MKVFKLALIIVALTFSALLSRGESLLGVSFGSPTLVGLRGVYIVKDSPWSVQGEYSRQVLFRNRSNGLLKIIRLDAQWVLIDSEGIVPFYFIGFDHFSGYVEKDSKSMSLLASEFGTGVKLEISESIILTSELGIIVPNQAVKGFENVGLVLNISLLFRMSP